MRELLQKRQELYSPSVDIKLLELLGDLLSQPTPDGRKFWGFYYGKTNYTLEQVEAVVKALRIPYAYCSANQFFALSYSQKAANERIAEI